MLCVFCFVCVVFVVVFVFCVCAFCFACVLVLFCFSCLCLGMGCRSRPQTALQELADSPCTAICGGLPKGGPSRGSVFVFVCFCLRFPSGLPRHERVSRSGPGYRLGVLLRGAAAMRLSLAFIAFLKPAEGQSRRACALVLPNPLAAPCATASGLQPAIQSSPAGGAISKAWRHCVSA